MNRKLRIWLLIFAILLVLIGWIVHKQWNNITAVVDAIRYSNEEVETKLHENTHEIQKYLKEEGNITVREMTEEEAKAFSEGTLTEEELIERMTGITPSVSQQDGKTPSTTDKPIISAEKTAEQIVAEAIAKLYITKNDYLGRLDGIEAYVRAQYIAMSPEEKKGAKQRLLSQYLPTVASWEAECDAAVYAVIDDVRAVLKANGQNQSVADQIEASYLNEKRLKKSYFINRYMD